MNSPPQCNNHNYRRVPAALLILLTTTFLISFHYRSHPRPRGDNTVFRRLQLQGTHKNILLSANNIFSFVSLISLTYSSIDENWNRAIVKESKMPKVLIYITTHMSQQHKEHLKHCWPLALKNSYLLNSSDIKVFMSPDPVQVGESIQLLKETFKGQNLSYHLHINKDYHRGAIAAMSESAKNGWFDGYDWVFRLNPDVIIQNDAWMLDTIKNDADASLIYIECQPHHPPRLSNMRMINTDFFGLKISALTPEQLSNADYGRAESLFSLQMVPIIERNEHRHVPDAYPLVNDMCRVNGNPHGSVFHFQDDYGWIAHIEDGHCPATFHNLEN